MSQLFVLMTLGFALGMLSGTLEPALLGHKVLELAPDRRNTALGALTFAGLFIAMITQPLVGALSDRTRTRWGRRVPYFVAGTLWAGACLILLASAPSFAFLVISVVVLQIGSNMIQGPWQALLPDHVPDRQRGLASGLKVLAEGSAAIVGRLIAGQLIGRVDEWGTVAVIAAIAVPSISLIVATLITTRALRALPTDGSITAPRSIRATLTGTFAIDLRTYPAFGWWFLNRLLFWCAVIAVSIFLLFFGIDVMGVTPAEAQRLISQTSAVLGGALLLCAIPASRLADRVSRKTLVFVGGLLAGAGTIGVLSTRDFGVMTIGEALIGAGVGIYLIADWALITAIVPRAEAARYIGIANVATAGGSAIARLLGGVLIDTLNAATHTTSIGYLTLYAIAAGSFLLSAFAILPLRTDVQA
jgi:MFS family permease